MAIRLELHLAMCSWPGYTISVGEIGQESSCIEWKMSLPAMAARSGINFAYGAYGYQLNGPFE